MPDLSLLPRRGLLKSLAALVTFGGGKAIAAGEAEPTEAEPKGDVIAHDTTWKLAHGGHWKISYVFDTPQPATTGRIVLEPLARWEVPEIVERGQPMPVDTQVSRWKESPSLIVRHWRPEDVEACSLCETCTAFPSRLPGREGLSVCAREGPHDLAAEDAPMLAGSQPLGPLR